MKAYERRETDAYPYYKLAVWDEVYVTWRAGKSIQETEAAARGLARKPGRYRISRIDEAGKVELPPFSV
jgi:hypothetical protein